MDELLEKLNKRLSPNAEPENDKELVRYVVKAMWVYVYKFNIAWTGQALN